MPEDEKNKKGIKTTGFEYSTEALDSYEATQISKGKSLSCRRGRRF